MFTYLFYLFTIVISVQTITCVVYTCDVNAACGCSTVSSTSVSARIVGGETAPNRAWGWIVSLQYGGSHNCGAFLVTSEFAITAAHCLKPYVNQIQSLSILAGTNYLNDQSSSIVQKRTVTAMYIHPNYDSTNNVNDIGLIRFASLSTESSSTLSFICLPSANQDPFSVGDTLVAIGWGILSFGSSQVSTALRQVTVKAVASDDSTCQRVPIRDTVAEFCASVSGGGKGNLNSIDKNVICAQIFLSYLFRYVSR